MFDDLIIGPIKAAFIAINGFTPEAQERFQNNTSLLFNQKYIAGWNSVTRGSIKDKAHVDYIQFNVSC